MARKSTPSNITLGRGGRGRYNGEGAERGYLGGGGGSLKFDRNNVNWTTEAAGVIAEVVTNSRHHYYSGRIIFQIKYHTRDS